MEKFKFYAPTKVYFGKDEEQRVGKILQEYHPKKVLIHYGGEKCHSIRSFGSSEKGT